MKATILWQVNNGKTLNWESEFLLKTISFFFFLAMKCSRDSSCFLAFVTHLTLLVSDDVPTGSTLRYTRQASIKCRRQLGALFLAHLSSDCSCHCFGPVCYCFQATRFRFNRGSLDLDDWLDLGTGTPARTSKFIQPSVRTDDSCLNLSLFCFSVQLQKTNFCGTQDGKRRTLLELFYNIVVGWIFVFVMISVKVGATRVKYSLYYLLIAAENVTMIVLWFLQPESQLVWYHLPALIVTCAFFVLGLCFMMIYYRHYHPDGKMPNKEESAKLF